MWRESSCSAVIVEADVEVVEAEVVGLAVVGEVWTGAAMGEGESQLRAM
jgi:hypothetical protein